MGMYSVVRGYMISMEIKNDYYVFCYFVEMKQRNLPNIVLLLIGLIGSFLCCRHKAAGDEVYPKQEQRDEKKVVADPAANPVRAEGLNRRVTHLIYTKHARCRMDCRHIDESEVREMLQHGEVNLKKSELADARGPKYAVEGITHDRQHVRIIFAQDPEGTAVVTVIDLDNEWQCDCK